MVTLGLEYAVYIGPNSTELEHLCRMKFGARAGEDRKNVEIPTQSSTQAPPSPELEACTHTCVLHTPMWRMTRGQ